MKSLTDILLNPVQKRKWHEGKKAV